MPLWGRSNTNRLTGSFLMNRWQAVVDEGTHSDYIIVKLGVPHSSVLWPSLFLIYVNHFPENLTSLARLFTDDTAVYRAILSHLDRPRGLTFMWWGCYGLNINQPSLPTPFYSVLASTSVLMALSTAFHSINSPDNSPFSDSVLLVLLCLIGPFNYISLYESLLQPWYNP